MTTQFLLQVFAAIVGIAVLIVLRNRLLPKLLGNLPIKTRSSVEFIVDLAIILLVLGVLFTGLSALEESAQVIAILITITTGAFIFTSEGWFQDMLGGISLKLSGLFNVDDVVTIAGNRGRVSHVGLFRTILETITLDVISVRNSVAMQDTIVNHSGIKFRAVSIIVHTADYGVYGDDVHSYVADVQDIARRVQMEICPAAVEEKNLHARAYFTEFGSSSDFIEVVYYTYDRSGLYRPALSAMHMAMAAELRPKGVVLGQVNANTIDNVLEYRRTE